MESMLDFGFAPLDGVLAGREKYIRLPIPELYDLAADRAETHNLADSAGERVRVLGARLNDYHASAPGEKQPESPEVAARLRALGYVSASAAPKSTYDERDDPKRLVDIDRLMHEAVALDDEGKLGEGIARYRQILAMRRDMMAASRHLAFDLWRVGDLKGAIATLRDAFAASPPTAGAKIQLGTYLSEAGQAAAAIERHLLGAYIDAVYGERGGRARRGCSRCRGAPLAAAGLVVIPDRFRSVLDELSPLSERFAAAGHRLYLVGGTVRDLLSANADGDNDFDATTTARPPEIKSLLAGW
jgi:hypothetical protein